MTSTVSAEQPRLTATVRSLWTRAPYANEILAIVLIIAVTLLFRPTVPRGIYAIGGVLGAGMALSAVAIILIYRTDGFVNFAQLQMVSTASALFVGLNTGQVFTRMTHSLCPGCVSATPGRLALNVNFVLSLVLVIGFMIGLNWLLYRTLFQRFTRAPRLLLTLVSIFLGEALISLQSTAINNLIPSQTRSSGGVSQPSGPPFDFTLHLYPITLHSGDVLLLGAGVVAILAIAQYLKRTQAGLAVRAASDNAERAKTLGMDVPGVSSRVWMIAGALAAVVGILQAFTHGLAVSANAGSQTDLTPQLPIEPLILVLAVAVLARFRSLTVTLLAALALGILQQSVQWTFGSTDPLNAVLVLIIGALLLMQRRRAGRDADNADSFAKVQVTDEPHPIPRELRALPSVRRWMVGGAVVLAAVLVGLPWLLNAGDTTLVGTYVIYTMVGFSLLILTGWAGQISLGQFGLAAIGAWVAAVCGLPFLLAVPLGAAAGVAAAVVVGLPALKLRGLHLAITSLAFALCAQTLFLGPRYLGSMLPAQLPPPVVLGLDFGDQRTMYYFLLIVLGLVVLAVVGLRRSRTGRVLIACRDNPAAAQSFGVNLLRARLTAFAVSGFIASLAGALFAYQQAQVDPASFTVDQSVQMTMFTAIGGLGGIAGPFLGFSVMAALQMAATNPVIRYASAGFGGVLLVLVVPGGIAQAVYAARDAALRRIAIRHRIPVVSLLGDRLARSLGEQALLGQARAYVGKRPPVDYKPTRQWALDRYGSADAPKERVGG
jgi:branched-chain amino acid transport system permease protein